MSSCRAGPLDKYDNTDGVQYVDSDEAHTFLWLLSPTLLPYVDEMKWIEEKLI